MKNRFIKGDKIILPDGRIKEVTESNNLAIVIKDVGNIGICTKTFPLIKLFEEKSLDKYDTAIIMCIKNNKINLKYEYQKDFIFTGSEKLLNNFREIAETYADSRAIPLESVKIEYINKAMIEIVEILCPEKFKNLMLLVMKNGDASLSIKEKFFIKLYGFIQIITLMKDGKEIYNLDYSLVESKGE